MYRIGVDSFIWSEAFSGKDVWIIKKAKDLGFSTIDLSISKPFQFPLEEVKRALTETGLEAVTTTTLPIDGNTISPDPEIRRRGILHMKKMIDISREIGSRITGGVNYAAWGYLTKKPRTEREWDWSIEAMREVAHYARETSEVTICVECINRFETHFLNIAADAVRYCDEVGTGNLKVHLDTFHMIREEKSFRGAVETCGKRYLGYIHVCENDRGIPGTGLVPWKEFFLAVKDVGYDGPMVIESFDPDFEELNGNCAIWRRLADSGEQLAVLGREHLMRVADEVWGHG